MELALDVARQAMELGEVPVGAVVVDGATGEVVGVGHNRVILDNDPTAHAEIVALREAAAKKGNPRLIDCDLYVTLEPCAMCAQAISLARIRRLYFAASDEKGGAVTHGVRLFESPQCFHRPEVIEGFGADMAGQLLRQFFSQRR